MVVLLMFGVGIAALAPGSSAEGDLDVRPVPSALIAGLEGSSNPFVSLPDGRSLMLQSESLVVTTPSRSMLRAAITQTVLLPQMRRFASLTVLPDGRVLIWGGVDAQGRMMHSGLWFETSTGELTAAADVPLVPRAGQTATVLTNGRLLVTGGWSSQLGMLSRAAIWDPRSGASEVVTSPLEPPRAGQTATLLPDGRVQLTGGFDQSGAPITNTSVFDPTSEQFQVVDDKTLLTPLGGMSAPKLQASIPTANAKDFPADGMLSLRFSEPMDLRTINARTMTLLGPGGNTPIKVVGVEAGRLAFITPVRNLYPGAPYTLFVQGVLSQRHIEPPFTTIDFSVAAESGGASTGLPTSTNPKTSAIGLVVDSDLMGPASAAPTTAPLYAMTGSNTTSATAFEPCGISGHAINTLCRQTSFMDTTEDAWYPGEDKAGDPHGGGWRLNKPDITPQEIAYAALMLRVPAGSGPTGVTGRIELVDGKPIGNVDVSIGNRHVRTDLNGWFKLTGVAGGHQRLYVDGTTANTHSDQYGQFVVGIDLRQGTILPLPYRMYLPTILSRDVVDIPSPTVRDMIITQPDMPGLEIRIPKGAVIHDHSGKIVTQLAIVPTPVDRAPFPTVQNFPVYFSIEPAGSTVQNIDPEGQQGIQIIYPNYSHLAPGATAKFFLYHPDSGWQVYGQGHVSADGEHVVPAPGVDLIWIMGGSFSMGDGHPGDTPQGKPCGCQAGDPVDLFSGTLEERHIDIMIRDIMPLTLTRYYHSMSTSSQSLGIADLFGNWRSNYDMYVYSGDGNRSTPSIRLPNGNLLPFNEITTVPGDVYTWTYAGSPSPWEGVTLEAAVGEMRCGYVSIGDECYLLTLKDGTQYQFSNVSPNELDFVRDRFGNQLSLTWNAGLLQQVTSPSGRFISFTYNGNNTVATATDNIGREWSYNYQVESIGESLSVTIDFLTSVVYPDSTSWSYAYQTNPTASDAGALLTMTDRDGNQTANQYSGEKVTRQTLADGKTWVFSYGTNTATVTDPNGNAQAVVFDPASGYPSSVTNGAGSSLAETTVYVRDGTGLVDSSTDALGRRTTYTYDANGNVLSLTRLAGTTGAVTERFTWTSDFNQIATYRDGLGQTTSFTYSDGCLAQIKDPLGHTVKISCSVTGQPLTITDPLSHKTVFSYQAYDLRSVTDALNRTTTFTTDALGRVIAVADPLGNLSRRVYDDNSRVAKVVDPMNNTTSIGYDGMGNVTGVILPNAGIIGYVYDGRNRLIKRTDALSRSESWTYNGMGDVVTHSDRSGQPTTYSYDALGRRIQTAYVDGSAIAATYDAGNRVIQLNDSAGGILSFGWDGLDRVKQATSPQGTVNYTYDKAGRRTSMTAASQAKVTYTYDKADRLTKLAQGSEKVTLTYDNGNRRKTLTLPNGVKLSYSYNNSNEVTAITYKQAIGTSLGNLAYTYDKTGRRKSQTGTFSPDTLPTTITQTSTFDLNNRQTSFNGTALQHDANGNLTFDGTNTYVWNARSQLVQIRHGGAVIDSFNYDALGRRQSKSINGDPAISFLYDGLNPVQETQGGAVTPILTGLRLDEYFARTGPSGRAYFLSDALGSTIGLTDTGGNLIQQYHYGPYGEANANNPGITNTYQYTGRENDGDGLYYYRARYYNPMMKRFISEDPIGFNGKQGNFYSYVNDRPIDSVDLLGLAYFARRQLGPLPWLGPLSDNPFDDALGTALSHEQLFFEDGQSPSNIGFFEDGKLHTEEDPQGYHREPEEYDDCIMRKAIKYVQLHKYHVLSNNCQDWANQVIQEYNMLKRLSLVTCQS